MTDLNTALFLLVNRFARVTGWLHGAAVAYASYGVVLFAVLLLAGWWYARSRTESTVMGAALWAPVGVLVALGVNQLAVAAVNEARPYAVLDHPLLLIAATTDPAFPSDHAVMAGAAAAGLWLVSRRLGLMATAAAVLMAAARVYVGAHWPGDVLVGLPAGTHPAAAAAHQRPGPAGTSRTVNLAAGSAAARLVALEAPAPAPGPSPCSLTAGGS